MARINGIVKVVKNGKYGLRATIPAEVVKELQLREGDTLYVSRDGDRIIMQRGVSV